MGEREERAQPVTWKVELTNTARAMLAAISDRRVQEKIARAIDSLAHEPDKKGKALVGDLAPYRSLRAVGQRYRIIYKTEHARVVVVVVALGARKEGSKRDIYTLARRLLRLGLLSPPAAEESSDEGM